MCSCPASWRVSHDRAQMVLLHMSVCSECAAALQRRCYCPSVLELVFPLLYIAVVEMQDKSYIAANSNIQMLSMRNLQLLCAQSMPRHQQALIVSTTMRRCARRTARCRATSSRSSSRPARRRRARVAARCAACPWLRSAGLVLPHVMFTLAINACPNPLRACVQKSSGIRPAH